MISSNFIFNFSIFCAIASLFLTKLLTFGFLVSTAVKPAAVVVVVVVVAKLVMLGILFLILFFSASRVVVVAKLAIVAISPLT